jgi:uncharacterized membrane protein
VVPPPIEVGGTAAILFTLDGILYTTAAGLMLVSGLKVGPSTASAIKNASPVPAILLAIPLLGELPGAGEVAGTAMIVSGVILLSGESGGRARTRLWRPVMIYPITAMLFFAADNVVRKAGVQNVAHPMIGGVVASVSMIAFALIVFAGTRSALPSLRAFRWFFLTGLFQGFAYWAIITALASGSIAVVVPLYTSSPIFVVLASRLFLGHLETLSRRLVLGVLTVFAGILIISFLGG